MEWKARIVTSTWKATSRVQSDTSTVGFSASVGCIVGMRLLGQLLPAPQTRIFTTNLLNLLYCPLFATVGMDASQEMSNWGYGCDPGIPPPEDADDEQQDQCGLQSFPKHINNAAIINYLLSPRRSDD